MLYFNRNGRDECSALWEQVSGRRRPQQHHTHFYYSNGKVNTPRFWKLIYQISTALLGGGEYLKGSHSLEDGQNQLKICAPDPLKTTYR